MAKDGAALRKTVLSALADNRLREGSTRMREDLEVLLRLQTITNGWYILTMHSALQRSVLGTMAAYAFVSAGMGAIMRCWVEAGYAQTELYRRLFLGLARFGLHRYIYRDLLGSV